MIGVFSKPQLGWVPVLIVAISFTATLSLAYWLDGDQRQKSEAVFGELTEDNRVALLGRLESYQHALMGAAGYYSASEEVTSEEWREYVQSLSLSDWLPGINGIGIIQPVEKIEIPAFLETAAETGDPDFRIHPETDLDTAFVIRHIEPAANNLEALGLDIAFEDGRRRAAIRARDTRTPQLTQRILLVQDRTKQPGFLLLNPIFRPESTTFLGWSYMPFVGSKTLQNLTRAQTQSFSLTVYDGSEPDEGALIYDERVANSDGPAFTRSLVVQAFGQDWLLVWESTPQFQASEARHSAVLALALGLNLTTLLGALATMLFRKERAVQKLAEEKTRESEARERQTTSIVENAMASIVLLDSENHIITANKATCELFAVDERDLIGAPLSKLVDEIDLVKYGSSKRMKATTSTGIPLVLDGRLSSWQAMDGTTQSVVILQDVTKEEASTQKLRESEDRWNTVLVGAEIGVFDVDLRTGQSIVSDMWKHLMGVPANTVNVDAQRLFLERIHPDDLAVLEAADADCIAGRTSRSVAQYRMKFGDNEWRWMRSDAVVAEWDDKGQAVRLLGAQTDITELRRAQEKLELSEQRFKSVLDNAPVGMAMCAENGDFLGVNGALCTLTGFSAEYMESRKLRDVMVREDFLQLLSNVEELRAQGYNSLKSECRMLTKDGEPKWGLVGVAWTADEVTNEDMYILQVQDISELKEVEKMKAQFVSTMSHELRTPLTSIKGALSLLAGQHGPQMEGSANRLVKIAQQNSERLIALVNDILDLEKISSGQSEFDCSRTNMSELVSQKIELMEPFAKQHGVIFRGHFPTISPHANVEPGRFQQVLSNLLSNAAKYSFDDSIVDVFLELVDNDVRVTVCNSGPGIAESFKPKIFMPFQQADSSDTRSNGGTGLGLNISKKIIEHMGGEIGFDSVVDGETRFWVTIPTAEIELEEDSEAADTSCDSKQPIKILHLEEDQDFAEIVRDSFGKLANVTSVGSLAAAQRQISHSSYDLIIVDWELPDGHGEDLFPSIIRHQASTPVFGLSAQEVRTRSDLIVADLVKSRTDLKDVVSKAIKCVYAHRQSLDSAKRVPPVLA